MEWFPIRGGGGESDCGCNESMSVLSSLQALSDAAEYDDDDDRFGGMIGLNMSK